MLESRIPGWIQEIFETPNARRKIENHIALGVPIGPLLGCGHFGCVFALPGTPWVAKITRDPTEGQAWTVLERFLKESDIGNEGLARIRQVTRLLPDVQWRGKTWPVYLVVREEVLPILKAHSIINSPENRNWLPQEIANLWKGLSLYRKAATKWHLAQKYKHVAMRKRTMEQAEEELQNATQFMGGTISGAIGETLIVLQEQDPPIILRDVHAGNIGFRIHEEIDGDVKSRVPIIFDPGHTPIETTEGNKAIQELRLYSA